eukprot:TRINITY_DN102295_c0_g1_i1.p1 TRINITY_DN102295_c0_g1~~TRINITY_DN102295_c0_g1_i1.p1  ORF type:complete len:349 (+),score=75.53 TRINITY_DN102295_c0_g1_i1:73-1119(+)
MAEVDLVEYLNQKKQQVAACQEAAAMAREQALALLQLQRRVAEIDALAFGGDDPDPSHGGDPSFAGESAAGGSSSLSAEDRRRFGLEVEAKEDDYRKYPPQQREMPSLPVQPMPMSRPASAAANRAEAFGSRLQDRRHVSFADNPSWQLPGEGGAGLEQRRYASTTSLPEPSGKGYQSHASSTTGSSLSAEDRLRFGLDRPESPPGLRHTEFAAPGGGLRHLQGMPTMASGSMGVGVRQPDRFAHHGEALPISPQWGGTSPAGRWPQRDYFNGGRMEAMGQAPTVRVGLRASEQHPDILWQRDFAPSFSSAPPTMQRTLAQLEAVGATNSLRMLEETERQLQMLKMSG